MTYQRKDGCLRLMPEGEIGHHEAQKAICYLENIIDLYDEPQVVLDLKGLLFMDSSGIAVLMSAYRNARDRGRSFRVLNTPQQAYKVLSAAGITKLIKFENEAVV